MRILIIEDDQQLCETLKMQLEHEGFQTDCVYNGTDALYYAMQSVYDIIILDRMLPEMNGLSLLKIIRENNISVPVILATAVDSVDERITGLDSGADDYLVKPYDIGELLARIRALSRRPNTTKSFSSLEYADLKLYPSCLELHSTDKKISSGKMLRLSRRECELLEYFIQNPERALPRQLLYTRIWGPDGIVEDGNLDTYIYYLRKHLRTLGSRVHISTIHGVGYRLEEKI